MFKKRVLLCAAVMLVALFAVGCQKDQMSVWFFGDEELTSARLGTYVDECTEVGGVVTWFPHGDKNVDLYGVYGIHYFDPVTMESPVEPNETPQLGVVPYVGVQMIMDLDYDAHVATMTGVMFENFLFVEHQYDAFDNDESKTMAGIRIRF